MDATSRDFKLKLNVISHPQVEKIMDVGKKFVAVWSLDGEVKASEGGSFQKPIFWQTAL